MDSTQLRKEFLDFFAARAHRIVPSSSLIPQGDTSVLFTTAGMQQFKPYYTLQLDPFKDNHSLLGEPLGNRNVASCQKCFRTTDIDSVGDERHLTFFEMLGNFSFGGYFKEEAINYAWEFINKILNIPLERIYVTVFAGDKEIPFDETSYNIWLKLGIPAEKILRGSREDNFWGPTGIEGPCGPTTEIYVDDIEIWNLVFNEYYQNPEKKLQTLKVKGVDTGMGLERLSLVVQFPQNKTKTVFDTDLFAGLMDILQGYSKNIEQRYLRIIADHFRAAAFLISEGIKPSNIGRGYILRRLIRRIIRYAKLLSLASDWKRSALDFLTQKYQGIYPLLEKRELILNILEEETGKFWKTLEKGLKEWQKILKNIRDKGVKFVSGEQAFFLYESYGFPLEMIEEIAREEGLTVDRDGFQRRFQEHQRVSRAGAEKKFGGHGITNIKDQKSKVKIIKLHTATHLLLQALREILSSDIIQKGSDITAERLRLDFNFKRKLTPEELQKVEDLVNQKIKENLEVIHYERPLKEALRSGALASFQERYPERVTIYEIRNPKTGKVFSKEICAGPHVKNTGELGRFKILKEESVGHGIRRIKATIE